MRIVLFDLGNTLLDDADRPLPGALETLEALNCLRDPDGQPVELALVSDYVPGATPEEVGRLQEEYYAILRQTGLDAYFLPLKRRVTLSTEVGVNKPDPRIFRVAIDKLVVGTPFPSVVFITENFDHVMAARQMGMMAIHFKGPGQSTGEVDQLPDLIPVLKRFFRFSPCCGKKGDAVKRVSSFVNKSKQVDSVVETLVREVRPERLKASINELTSFGTRFSFSPNIDKVTEWIHQRFLDLGYSASETRFQPFTINGGTPQRNVLCGPGRGHPGFVLLCGHYDSISEKPAVNAPGADDNASGVALLLEVAYILKEVSQRRGVLFAAFGGEEQGLFGSIECAEIAAAEGWKIDLVINVDMIAYQDPQRPQFIRVEYDQGNLNPGNDAAAKAYGLLMAQMAADYTSLAVEHTDIYRSDYMPFEEKGYPCIGVYEAADNPANHSSGDTEDWINSVHLSEVTKMVLATIYTLVR